MTATVDFSAFNGVRLHELNESEFRALLNQPLICPDGIELGLICEGLSKNTALLDEGLELLVEDWGLQVMSAFGRGQDIHDEYRGAMEWAISETSIHGLVNVLKGEILLWEYGNSYRYADFVHGRAEFVTLVCNAIDQRFTELGDREHRWGVLFGDLLDQHHNPRLRGFQYILTYFDPTPFMSRYLASIQARQWGVGSKVWIRWQAKAMLDAKCKRVFEEAKSAMSAALPMGMARTSSKARI